MALGFTVTLIWVASALCHAKQIRANNDIDWVVDSGNLRKTYVNGCDPDGRLTIDVMNGETLVTDFQGTVATQENFIAKMNNPKTGMCRHAMIRLPSQYYDDDHGTIPAVYYFHGDMKSDRFESVPDEDRDSGWFLASYQLGSKAYGPFADENDFPLILVSPFGSRRWDGEDDRRLRRLGPTSNKGFGWEIYDEEGGSYDEHFIRSLHDKVIEKFPKIDIDRTFVSGHSSGAMFTFRAASVMSDIFLAGAPRAGRLWGNEQWFPSNCDEPADDGDCLSSPLKPMIPLQYQVGDADTKPKGGTINACQGFSEPCIASFGLDASIFQFAVHSGCLTTRLLSNASPNEGRSDWNWEFPTDEAMVNEWVEEEGLVNTHPFVVYEFCGGEGPGSVKYIKWADQPHSFRDVKSTTWERNVQFFRSTSNQTTSVPTNQPTPNPTSQPTNNPTNQPTPNPTSQPTNNPTNQPTPGPSTFQPSPNPTSQPIPNPTSQPNPNPISQPTTNLTSQPTANPTRQPTPDPTSQLTSNPTNQPSPSPTGQPATDHCVDDPVWRMRGNNKRGCAWIDRRPWSIAKKKKWCGKRANKPKTDKTKVWAYCKATCNAAGHPRACPP